MDAIHKIQAFVSRYAMFRSASGVVVAVSGGPDSVVLLDVLLRLVSERTGAERYDGAQTVPSTGQSSLTLIVAHFDHLLRGEESTGDALFVERLAHRYGVRARMGRADVRQRASDLRRGIEEVARELRYEFLLKVAEETGADRIATGHTMTDQAETLLMRLVRGSGTHGLAAMRPVSSVPLQRHAGSEGAGQASAVLVRPMLCLTREEVEEYCRDHKLEFRTDASNLSLDYTRNRIRHKILPEVRSINSKADAAFARASELFAADDDALQLISDSALTRARPEAPERAVVEFDCARAFSVAEFLSQPAGIARRMIIGALKQSKPDAQIGMTHVAAVDSLIHGDCSGKRVVLPGGVAVWRDREFLVFKPESANDYEVELNAKTPEVEAGGFVLSTERCLPIGELNRLIQRCIEENKKAGENWMTAVLDDGLLPDSLLVRTRRRGERARFYGQKAVKKLKNLMIDNRIPVSRRPAWPVVASVDGRYVWSPGLPPAIEFCARNETRALALLRASTFGHAT